MHNFVINKKLDIQERELKLCLVTKWSKVETVPRAGLISERSQHIV